MNKKVIMLLISVLVLLPISANAYTNKSCLIEERSTGTEYESFEFTKTNTTDGKVTSRNVITITKKGFTYSGSTYGDTAKSFLTPYKANFSKDEWDELTKIYKNVDCKSGSNCSMTDDQWNRVNEICKSAGARDNEVVWSSNTTKIYYDKNGAVTNANGYKESCQSIKSGDEYSENTAQNDSIQSSKQTSSSANTPSTNNPNTNTPSTNTPNTSTPSTNTPSTNQTPSVEQNQPVSQNVDSVPNTAANISLVAVFTGVIVIIIALLIFLTKSKNVSIKKKAK